MLQHAHRVRRATGLAERFDALHRDVAGERVDVAVDQARHQGAPAGIDDARVRRRDALRRDLLNQPVGDEHVHPFGTVGVRAVEDAGVGDEDLRHGVMRRRERLTLELRSARPRQVSAVRPFGRVPGPIRRCTISPPAPTLRHAGLHAVLRKIE
jgi:hypothetical protein